MKREDLTKLGLTDDAVVDAIMSAHGKDIEKHKTAAETAKAESEALKGQLTEANTQIESFKGMNIDQIKASADEWKAKAEQAQRDSEAKISALKLDHDLERELKETYKVKDPSDVMPHLNREKIQRSDDGKLIGLKEQVEPLKASKDYLFADEQPVPKLVTGSQNHSVIGDAVINAARQAANLPAAK